MDYSFIAKGVETPNALNTIGQVMSIKQQKAALTGQEISNTANQAVLDEQTRFRSALKDPNFLKSISSENGDIDFTKAIPTITKLAPTQGAAFLSQMAAAQQSSTAAKNAILKLNEDQLTFAGKFLMSQANDPNATPESIMSGLQYLVKKIPQIAPAADFFTKTVLAPNSTDLDKLRNGLLNAGQQVMSAAEQVTAVQPSYVSTGGQQFNVNPLAHGSPEIVNRTIDPSQMQTLGSPTPSGNPTVVNRAPTGEITGITQAPIGQGVNYPHGESPESFKTLSGEREQTKALLGQTPQLHQTNRDIIMEMDKVAATGQLGSIIQKTLSSLGIVNPTVEQTASAYDIVGKNQERNALAAAQAMGNQTVAGLEAQIRANGSNYYNPTAIKYIAKLNDAYVSGVEAYQPGLDKAIQNSPDGVFAKRQFDTQWAQNFDPRIMQLYNAQKSGDKAEINNIIHQMGGKDSKQMKELLQKAKNIQMLSNEGRL